MDIIDFPTEILIEIFGFLGYWDLKLAIPLVCKRFYFIVSENIASTALDQALFRDEFRAKPKHVLFRNPHLVTKTHPVLDMLRCNYAGSIFDIYFADNKSILRNDNQPTSAARDGRHKLTDFFSVGRENAISPAVIKLHLHANSYGCLGIVKGTGKGGAVTIFDVMERVIKMYRRKVRIWWWAKGRYCGIRKVYPCDCSTAKLFIAVAD